MTTLKDLKNLKIGDRIRFFVNQGILSSRVSSETMVGTVFAISRDREEFLIGWKSGEECPSDAHFRNGSNPSTNYIYAHNQMEFVTRLYLFSYYEIDSIIDGSAERKKSKIDLQNDISKEMSFFSSSLPGECICRIPRNMCTYHK